MTNVQSSPPTTEAISTPERTITYRQTTLEKSGQAQVTNQNQLYLVSVVTVSINAIATISDTLESVAGQRASFRIEHLCIDGGSSDGTRSCIYQYALTHSDVHCIFEPDYGIFDAMNKGLRLARGQYVLFLNADDFLASPTALAEIFAEIGADEQTGGAPDMILGSVVMGRFDHFGLWRMRTSARWLLSYPRSGAHPPHQATFVKPELLRAIGAFDISARAASDTAAFYKLVRMYPQPTMHISRVIISFMRNGGASNAGLNEYRRGNIETYSLLRAMEGPAIASLSIVVKMLQKVFEFRLGTLRSRELGWWN